MFLEEEAGSNQGTVLAERSFVIVQGPRLVNNCRDVLNEQQEDEKETN